MADVAVTVQLMPESSESDLDKIEATVREKIKVHSIKRKPIAFGIQALEIITLVPDAEGGTENLEKTLAAIASVGNVQVTNVTRLL